MSALVRQVALVSESSLVQMHDLMKVSAALQKQASRDLAPIWEISATVDAFDKLEDVPDGYWPLIIKDDIGQSGAAGVHMDKDGQPFALITSSQSLDEWSLTASHEMCEMLVDPSGNRQVTGNSPKPDQGRVSFLVEVSDPSEAADFAYTVNSILVSDFYTPHYFDPNVSAGVKYSFTGAITRPRQVLRGGYLSWKDSVSGHWWQEVWFNGGQPSFRDIGPADAKAGSIRAFIDRITSKDTLEAMGRGRVAAVLSGRTLAQAQPSLNATAAMWREQIDAMVGRRSTRRGAAKQTRRLAKRHK